LGSSIRVITALRLRARLRTGLRLSDAHCRSRRRRRRRNNVERVISVHWRRNDGTSLRNNGTSLRNNSPVPNHSTPLSPASRAACAEAHTAAGDCTKDDNVEDEVENDGTEGGDGPVDFGEITVILIDMRWVGGPFRAILTSVAIFADADVDLFRWLAIHAADDNRSVAGLERNVLSNANIQVGDSTRDTGTGSSDGEIEGVLGLLPLTEESHVLSGNLKGEGTVNLTLTTLAVRAAQAELGGNAIFGNILVRSMDKANCNGITLRNVNREVSAPVDDGFGKLVGSERNRFLHLASIIPCLNLFPVMLLVRMVMVVMVRPKGPLYIVIAELSRIHGVGFPGEGDRNILCGPSLFPLSVLETAETRLVHRMCKCGHEKHACNNQNNELLVHN